MTESLCPSDISQHPRCSVADIEKQSRAINTNRQLLDVLDGFPGFVLVLNRTRQIVFANAAFLHFLGASNLAAVLGKKPGDALACEHAVHSAHGCGTTDFCSTCGAAKASPPTLPRQLANAAPQECRINQEGSGRAFDFRVQTAPFPGADDSLYLFFLTDVSHEKRRRALERIFFHDVANIANGMVGLSRILCERELGAEKKKQFHEVLHRAAHRLTDEVEAQRVLVAAESNELRLDLRVCASRALLEEVAAFYNSGGHNCRVEVEAEAVDREFVTDLRLLHRILINMTKNAVEASPHGAVVRLGCDQAGDDLEIWVHNQGSIPEKVRLQIFQRSFSTKGTSRGLGTYSMKLLGERYLKGWVSFTSSPEEGTTFRFRCPGSIETAST